MMEKKTVTDQLKSFHAGTNSKAYELYGCHLAEDGSCVFRVWAPHAESVGLVLGEGKGSYDMDLMEDGESYEFTAPPFTRPVEGRLKYCYEIRTKDGRTLRKADPYGYMLDCKSGMSVVCRRPETAPYKPCRMPSKKDPVNIFEVNLFSWARKPKGGYLSAEQLTKKLVPYVSRMDYTHVEFMPLNEYPYDGSWGYQVLGYFAVTQRLGKPEDLQRLIGEFHEYGIKVVLDWVPAHFPKDSWGLYEFDGQPLYESALWDRMETGWGTRRFAFERPEVVSFLLSSARYLVETFDADAIRIDAVASMLSLDYDRKPGDFTPNKYGDNRNLEGIAFLQSLNSMLHTEFPWVQTMAEDSSIYSGITKPVADGGLGFDYKWDLGWMNDTLFYMKQDPVFRHWHHDKLTFSMMYAFNESYILPLSHDEVVHVKGSIVNKMPGSYEDKFAQERLLMGYMYSHPGKKLNFMGYDIAQFDEWDYNGHIQYELKKFPMHRKMQSFIKKLNTLYFESPALYEEDSWDGYKWLVVDDRTNNVIVYERTAPRIGEKIIVVCSFCGADLKGYRFGCEKGKWQVILNTDAKMWGGRGITSRKRFFKTEKKESHGKEDSICMDIPRLSCIYLMKIQ